MHGVKWRAIWVPSHDCCGSSKESCFQTGEQALCQASPHKGEITAMPKTLQCVTLTVINSLRACVLSCVQLFCDPKDCSPPGSSAHGIFQVRILEKVSISYSRESSRPRDQTHISCIGRWILYHCITWEAYIFDTCPTHVTFPTLPFSFSHQAALWDLFGFRVL